MAHGIIIFVVPQWTVCLCHGDIQKSTWYGGTYGTWKPVVKQGPKAANLLHTIVAPPVWILYCKVLFRSVWTMPHNPKSSLQYALWSWVWPGVHPEPFIQCPDEVPSINHATMPAWFMQDPLLTAMAHFFEYPLLAVVFVLPFLCT